MVPIQNVPQGCTRASFDRVRGLSAYARCHGSAPALAISQGISGAPAPNCGAMTPSGDPLPAPDHYSIEATPRLVILFYYFSIFRAQHVAMPRFMSATCLGSSPEDDD